MNPVGSTFTWMPKSYGKEPENAMTIMYSKEDITDLRHLKVQTSRESNILSESTPHCAGKNPQDAKQHHFHGKAETDMVRRQGWKS